MENDFLNLRCGWRVALLFGIMCVHSCFFFFFFFFFFFVIHKTKQANKTCIKDFIKNCQNKTNSSCASMNGRAYKLADAMRGMG